MDGRPPRKWQRSLISRSSNTKSKPHLEEKENQGTPNSHRISFHSMSEEVPTMMRVGCSSGSGLKGGEPWHGATLACDWPAPSGVSYRPFGAIS